jgi:hypothetical protein
MPADVKDTETCVWEGVLVAEPVDMGLRQFAVKVPQLVSILLRLRKIESRRTRERDLSYLEV